MPGLHRGDDSTKTNFSGFSFSCLSHCFFVIQTEGEYSIIADFFVCLFICRWDVLSCTYLLVCSPSVHNFLFRFFNIFYIHLIVIIIVFTLILLLVFVRRCHHCYNFHSSPLSVCPACTRFVCLLNCLFVQVIIIFTFSVCPATRFVFIFII